MLDGLTMAIPVQFGCMKELAAFLLQYVLKSFKLLNVKGLEANQLVFHDECHFFCCIDTSMPVKTYPHL